MPKKAVTTKEAIVEGAFQLIREQGLEALTARNLAALLGCSTQPVMYQFPNLETLKDLVYQRADAFHTEYLLSGEDLLEIGLRYVRFAREEPRLFRFLFQSNRFSGLNPEDLIRAPEAAALLSAVGSEEGLDPEAAFGYFEPLAALVHGYASFIANNAMQYEPEAIRKALLAVTEGLEKERKSYDEPVQKE